MKVGLTSESIHKITPTKNAVKVLIPRAQVCSVASVSSINEQPVGIAETLHGARSRIGSVNEPGLAMTISIENGILVHEASVKDFGIVVISGSKGEVWEVSQMVTFPWEQYEKARDAGFEKYTVGNFLEKDGITKDGADPHKELCGLSRSDILYSAITAALYRYKRL